MAEEVDTLFHEAVEALRVGERARAKDLLTRLLKTDQNNVNYWIWMSAAVETAKERVYCLQTALRIAPENATAKRGLILLGALPPDESIQPFPLNRPRAWEDQLLLEHERPVEKKPLQSNPLARVAGLGVVGLALCGLMYFMFVMPRMPRLSVVPTFTFGPSPTFTLTPTAINTTPQATAVYVGPTPLWASLSATYTPTPFYNPTPRQPQSGDIFRAANVAYAKNDWEGVILYMQQIAAAEPDAADPWFFMGEAYRFEGKYEDALTAYEKAISLNPNYGPSYVGRARVNMAIHPEAEILTDLDAAVEKDPAYAEAFLARAMYKISQKNASDALDDLKSAEALTPNSALVEYLYALAFMNLNDPQTALTHAQRAKDLDITLLDNYLLLSEAYAANGKNEEALNALQTYVTYAEEDEYTLFLQGKLKYLAGDYAAALKKLDASIKLKNNPEARLYRGLTYLRLNQPPDAVYELRVALQSFPESFETRIALAEAFLLNNDSGNAYLQADSAFRLAGTDEQRAQVYYWRARAQEEMGQMAGAKRDWEALLALPKEAVPSAWLAEARQGLLILTTPSRTPTVTKTPLPKTPTPTPK